MAKSSALPTAKSPRN